MSGSFASDVEFNRYLFEYRHENADWGIEIVARSPEEARERIKALTWARYQGEVVAKIPIPTTTLVRRLIPWFSQITGFFKSKQ